jgi:hypothetical protein
MKGSSAGVISTPQWLFPVFYHWHLFLFPLQQIKLTSQQGFSCSSYAGKNLKI